MAIKPDLTKYDLSGKIEYVRKKSNYVNLLDLAANVAESDTPPENAKYVIFSSEGNYWVQIGGTAVVPTGDISDGSAPLFNPSVLLIENETSISVISESGAKVVLEYFA